MDQCILDWGCACGIPFEQSIESMGMHERCGLYGWDISVQNEVVNDLPCKHQW